MSQAESRPRTADMNIQKLIEEARWLRSVEGENPEYDRALVELVGAFLPGESEDRYGYLYPLILDRPFEDARDASGHATEGTQDFQDDLEMWGDCSAMVTLFEGGAPATDLILTPEQVRVMFAALRDHANGNWEVSE